MFSRKLSAGDICTRVVSIAYRSLSIEEAARVMRDRAVGCLVVVDDESAGDRQVVGILTDRDIAMGIVAARRRPDDLCVFDLMSKDVVTVGEEDSVLDVLAAMRRKAVRRVPVVGARDRLVGILAMDDVLEVLAEQMQAVSAAIGATQHRPRPL